MSEKFNVSKIWTLNCLLYFLEKFKKSVSWPLWLSWMHVQLVVKRSRVRCPPGQATFFCGDWLWSIFLWSFCPFCWFKKGQFCYLLICLKFGHLSAYYIFQKSLRSVLLFFVVSKDCWMSGKQCRLWSDVTFCSIQSGLHSLLSSVMSECLG